MKVRADRKSRSARHKCTTVSILWMTSLLCSEPIMASDWPSFRGPNQDGIATATGLVDSWSLGGKHVRWSSPIGGLATPVIVGDRIYLNCVSIPEDADNPGLHTREQVVCRSTSTGKVLWRDEFNVFQTDISAERVGWASMAADKETGNVYLHSVSGLFRCYSRDGKLIWQHSLAEEYGKISGYGGRTQSPIIDEDRVIISFLAINWGKSGSPPPLHYYYAFDKRSGKLLWTAAPGGKPHDTNYSVPIVREINGTRMLIGGNSDGCCYAINARTGKLLWRFAMSKRAINATAATDGHLVYISHGEDNLDNLEFGSVVCIDARGEGDITTSHCVWRVDGIKAGYASLLVKDGILYVVSDIGSLHALDAKTGETLWRKSLGTMGRGSPVWADGKLFLTEVHGNVLILKTSRSGCDVLSHVKIPSRRGAEYDAIFASPAVADNAVYIVTSERTLCLAKEGSASPSLPAAKENSQSVATGPAALAHLVPHEVLLRPGEKAKFELRLFDENGQSLSHSVEPTLRLSEQAETNLLAAKITGNSVAGQGDLPWATEIKGMSPIEESLQATARIRYLPDLPWRWDFESEPQHRIPATWISGNKLVPVLQDDNHVLVSSPGRGRPSAYVWLGTPQMRGYTIQADVMSREQRRQISNLGVTAQRYNLILKGNTSELEIQSWAPQLRMARRIPFRWEPNEWYTLKLHVQVSAGGIAQVQGKAWKRSEAEPANWTLVATDPHANRQGSPGLYMYRLTECYFDNILVTEEN